MELGSQLPDDATGAPLVGSACAAAAACCWGERVVFMLRLRNGDFPRVTAG